MHILAIDDDPWCLMAIDFYFERFNGIEVIHAKPDMQVINQISENLQNSDIKMIICQSTSAEYAKKIYHSLLQSAAKIPFILFSKERLESYAGYENKKNFLGEITQKNFFEDLDELLNWSLDESFVPVRLDLLEKIQMLPANIYLKINHEKNIMLYKRGDSFTSKDKKKFNEKNITHLFLEKNQFPLITQSIQKKLLEYCDSKLLTLEEKILKIQELTAETCHYFSLSEDLASKTQTSLNFCVEYLVKKTHYGEIIDKIIDAQNFYIPHHGILVGLFAVALARNLPWFAENTAQKLLYAALLHDIGINHLDFEEGNALNDYALSADKKIHGMDFEKFKTHPFESYKLIKKMPNLPSDIDRIVLEHHERPHGDGIPKGLNGSQIGALSALFILAHDMADMLYALKKDDKNLGEPWEALNKKLIPENYPGAQYKKILPSLDQLKSFFRK